MSIDQIQDEIRHFLRDEENLALCLTGKWGVGKTYTWDMLIREVFKDKTVHPNRYSYVSLFGLENLGDVCRSLFENTVEAAAFEASKPFEASISSVVDRFSHFKSKWRAGAGIIQGIPVVSDYASRLHAINRIIAEDIREPVCIMEDDLQFYDNFTGLASSIDKLPVNGGVKTSHEAV